MMLVFKIFVTEAAVDVPWVLPKEKFFEWEEKDVPFCRKYGFGHAGEPKPSTVHSPGGFRSDEEVVPGGGRIVGSSHADHQTSHLTTFGDLLW